MTLNDPLAPAREIAPLVGANSPTAEEAERQRVEAEAQAVIAAPWPDVARVTDGVFADDPVDRRRIEVLEPDVRRSRQVETMLAERAREWTKQWWEGGLQEGRQEGRQEGEAAILLHLLRAHGVESAGDLDPLYERR